MIEITGYVDNANEYNRQICEFRSSYKGHPGCVSTWACEYCGALNTDSLCLCSGKFTCQKCTKNNDIYKIGNIKLAPW